MAISNTTPNIIKASDILNLENNSINTGEITCSSIKCTGQIQGGEGYKNAVKSTLIYEGLTPSIGSSITFSTRLFDYDFVLLWLHGFHTAPVTLQGYCFQWFSSYENNAIFYDPPTGYLYMAYFPQYGKKMTTYQNNTGATPTITIIGRNYFV